MRVLVVEDEPKMAGLVKRGLEEEGIAVDVSGRGEDAVWMAGSTEYDVVVLDVMLPGLDGFEVCRRLRADEVWTPVLMLTARDAVEDRVAGLDGGADDYLVKPFSFDELLARLRALARRGSAERPAVLEAGDLRLDPATRRASRGDVEIALSQKEYALLETLMRRPGVALSRLQLLEHAWDDTYENRSNVIDVYIRYLREKIDRPFGTDTIETVRGVGYRLRRMSRIPIRIRLTLAFVLALGVVMAALGWIVYSRFEDSLNDNTDRALRSRATDIAALIERSGPRIPGARGERFIESEESFTQILDDEGTIVDATSRASSRALLTPDEVRRVQEEGSLTLSGQDVVEEGDPARLFAVPVSGYTLVVGQATDDNEESLTTLRLLLGIGLPIALILASLAGYAVAAAALRPVEAMRRKAAEVSDDRPGEQLPIPPADDEIRRLGETLNAMLARLEAALERERGFVADASHELRTPLASLKTELELALRARPHAGRAAARAQVGHRGDRPPQPPRRRPARARALGPRDAAAEDRADSRAGAPRRRGGAVPHNRARRSGRGAGRPAAERRPAAARAGDREPRRQRGDPRRRRGQGVGEAARRHGRAARRGRGRGPAAGLRGACVRALHAR